MGSRRQASRPPQSNAQPPANAPQSPAGGMPKDLEPDSPYVETSAQKKLLAEYAKSVAPGITKPQLADISTKCAADKITMGRLELAVKGLASRYANAPNVTY